MLYRVADKNCRQLPTAVGKKSIRLLIYYWLHDTSGPYHCTKWDFIIRKRFKKFLPILNNEYLMNVCKVTKGPRMILFIELKQEYTIAEGFYSHYRSLNHAPLSDIDFESLLFSAVSNQSACRRDLLISLIARKLFEIG